MSRILVVDDEVLVAGAILRNLSGENVLDAQMSCVYSVDQAREVFQRENIDVLLCDIEMPDGSGLELLEWVKCCYPYTECIMLTCHAEFEYLRQAMRMGCMDYVLKPIDYSELTASIMKALDKIRWQKALLNQELLEKKDYLDGIFRALMQSEYYNRSDSLEDRVKFYVREHMMEPITIQSIADYVNLSASHLMKSFKKKTGVSILQFITCERLKASRELLVKTELSVSEVAMAVGYDDYSYFIRLFKREMGVTPMNYRKQQGL